MKKKEKIGEDKMINIFETKVFWAITFIAIIGNFTYSIIQNNYLAYSGWFVCICWYPYKKLSQKQSIKKGDESK